MKTEQVCVVPKMQSRKNDIDQFKDVIETDRSFILSNIDTATCSGMNLTYQPWEKGALEFLLVMPSLAITAFVSIVVAAYGVRIPDFAAKA